PPERRLVAAEADSDAPHGSCGAGDPPAAPLRARSRRPQEVPSRGARAAKPQGGSPAPHDPSSDARLRLAAQRRHGYPILFMELQHRTLEQLLLEQGRIGADDLRKLKRLQL